MMNWIIKNYEWIFGGIGATLLGIIITYFLDKKKKLHNKCEKTEIHQTNTGANAMQIGIQQNYYSGGKEGDR